MSQPTNRDFVFCGLRQEKAMEMPKGHIPAGVGVFTLLMIASPIGWLPFAGAALVGYDAMRRLKKSRQLVKGSFSLEGEAKLLGSIKTPQLDIVEEFVSEYPLEAALGKKPSPQPMTAAAGVTQERPQQLSNPTPQPESTAQCESAPPVQEVPTVTADDVLLDRWQPEQLPEPYLPYLASQIHLLIAATTGSGKTWLLRALCTLLSNRDHTLLICDPKGTQWGDLSPAVMRMKTGLDYLTVMRDLDKELNKRIELLQTGQPVGNHLWVIFDEWTLLKGKCQTLEAGGKSSVEQRLLNLIAAGRELNMHLIMVNQSHLLGDLSISGSKNTFSSGLRDNLCTLGLGCKETQDNAGNPMKGNSKSIDSMLRDRCLVASKEDREAAETYHAALRRQATVNRTFALYASQLFIGTVPNIDIPELFKVEPFYKHQVDL
jgi:hypothetical protein